MSQKISQEETEEIIQLLLAGKGLRETARITGRSPATVKKIKDTELNDPELKRARTQVKEKIALNGGEILKKLYALMDRRVERALEHEDEIDKLLEQAAENANGNDKKFCMKGALRTISKMKVDDVGRIAQSIGIIGTREAIRCGEPTERVENVIKNLIGDKF